MLFPNSDSVSTWFLLGPILIAHVEVICTSIYLGITELILNGFDQIMILVLETPDYAAIFQFTKDENFYSVSVSDKLECTCYKNLAVGNNVNNFRSKNKIQPSIND